MPEPVESSEVTPALIIHGVLAAALFGGASHFLTGLADATAIAVAAAFFTIYRPQRLTE